MIKKTTKKGAAKKTVKKVASKSAAKKPAIQKIVKKTAQKGVKKAVKKTVKTVATSKPVLVDIQKLSVDFQTGNKKVHAVKKVDIKVYAGEVTAIVGESGSGKSSVALSIAQLLPYPVASHPSGKILFKGQNVIDGDKTFIQQLRGDKIGFIFQEPLTALNPLHKVGKQIVEMLELHQNLSDQDKATEVDRLLKLVQLNDAERIKQAYPHQLSGGQRQRVMIAMAIANKPDLLIADEPTTALDVQVEGEILDLLVRLQNELGMAMLLVTHDLGVVQKLAKHLTVMKDGQVVEQGLVSTVFKKPKTDYTKHLLSAVPKGDVTTKPTDQKVLDVENLVVDFPIKRNVFGKAVESLRAVDHVSLTLNAGETLGVVGESGSGKSTLGFAILRLLKSSGRIVWMGRPLHEVQARQLRRLRADLQIIFQDPYGALNPRLTVGEIIGEGLGVHRPELLPERCAEMIKEILEEVGLSADMLNRYPHEFSGGQRQRIAVARAVILRPKLLVLDEPTSALDVSVQAQMIDLLTDLQEKHGLSYIFISHDLRVVRAMSHRILVLKDGRVVEEGQAKSVFTNPQTPYTKLLMQAARDKALK